jgi:hypothetical protein
MDKIELVAWKDHALGGFRLYRKNDADLWAAEIMDDADTLSDDPRWDLRNWIEHLSDPARLWFQPAVDTYPVFYRLSQEHHGAWNVCNHLQHFLPNHIDV